MKFNENNFIKNVVHIVVIIFCIVIILVFILLLLYYITPNNYELVNLDKFNDNDFILMDVKKYSIKPNTTIEINSDKYMKFSKQTNIIIKNFIKSQNIYTNDEFIKTKYNSDIVIFNNDTNDKFIEIYFYSKY